MAKAKHDGVDEPGADSRKRFYMRQHKGAFQAAVLPQGPWNPIVSLQHAIELMVGKDAEACQCVIFWQGEQ